MRKESTKDLKTGLKRGEGWAFEEMYRIAFNGVATFVKKNSGTMDDAKDLFQDALIILVAKVREPDFKFTSQPATYFYQVVRFQWLKRLRKKKNLKEDFILDESDLIIQVEDKHDKTDSFEMPDSPEDTPTKRIAKEQFGELSDICQKIIIMKHVYGMKHNEIIEETGDSESYSKVKLFNCMKQWRKKINAASK